MNFISKKNVKILSTVLCITLTFSTTSITFADSTITTGTTLSTASDISDSNAVQDKLASVEKAVYGTTQTGAIIDRINKLEQDYYGTSKNGNLFDRINNIYAQIFTNTYSPSAIAQMNGIEWSLMHQVSMHPIGQRLSDLETMLYGKPKSGTYYSRMLSLGNAAFGSSQQAIPLSHTLVPANTLIKIKLVTPLNSETMKAGDEVKYQVAEDVIYNGSMVFAAGGLGEGTVTSVSSAKNFGRDGKIGIDFAKTQAFDGTIVDTILGEKAKKEMKSEAMAAGASVAGMVLLGPIGIVGGVFVKGKNINLPAGTELFIQTKSDITLYGTPANSTSSNNTLNSTAQTVTQTSSSAE
ncbi:hypothetical protein [Pectinatus frisingensis]|uniref:hypothetical protein n=1 Tax=Pectinatus frisingensis TaxID=865 RepID=UPI0015F52395|nr:hypothetical protein [Pectinatus frisingensis]